MFQKSVKLNSFYILVLLGLKLIFTNYKTIINNCIMTLLVNILTDLLLATGHTVSFHTTGFYFCYTTSRILSKIVTETKES